MTHAIDLSPEAEAWLEHEASERGQAPAEYLQATVESLFLSKSEAVEIDAGWAALGALIDRCRIDTGISDLAHQHDHYIHGTPKRETESNG